MSAQKPARSASSSRKVFIALLGEYSRALLAVGVVVLLVALVVLGVLWILDTFNAAVYSVDGKNISDATDEARSLRDMYGPARGGAIVVMVFAAVFAALGAVGLYLNRDARAAQQQDDDGDVGVEDMLG
ncbi:MULTISPECIES: hypothetical protein [Arthrobacter]|uniref:Uncharacterized protein n=2 Tax=Arthrobacter TaxID=1663 RepID=A0ABU9KPA4_9MICC|nr:hypothetical protein [Arthrobacter sp. YJM1]MDP5228740.1 hypothetical protein [Arthrobacter sp. YJM1]